MWSILCVLFPIVCSDVYFVLHLIVLMNCTKSWLQGQDAWTQNEVVKRGRKKHRFSGHTVERSWPFMLGLDVPLVCVVISTTTLGV